jgi:hypothetical protein
MWGFFSLNAGNGGVREVSVSGNRAYVAGMFDYVGPNTGSLAMLDGTNQNLLSEENCPYFEIDGSINQIIDDGNGNAIIAGTFNYVQGVKRHAIAKIKPDCTLDSSFNANLADPTAEVRSILMHNGKLFIAGLFSGTFATTGNDTRTNVAVINAATGVIDPSWDANMLGSEVNVIKTDGTNLFLGGSFYQIGALSVNNLAKVDMTSGTVVSSLGEPDNTVQTIWLDGTSLYVGGNFNSIDGNTTNYFAKITNTGTFLWGNSNIDTNVQSVLLANNKVYVGGNFTTPRQGLLTFDPTTGTDLLKDFGISSGVVYSIRQLNGKLFLFGSFASILNNSTSYIVCLDPLNDTIVNWNARIAGPNSQERGDIYKFSNGNYLVGASFPTLQGKARTYLAEIDLTTGQPTDWNPTFSFPGGVEVIQAMYLSQNRLYIGGSFTAVNSSTRTRFASFDLSSSPPTLSSLNVSISGYTNNVWKISEFNNQILIAGAFYTVNGNSINHIVTLNPDTGVTSYGLNPNSNFGLREFLKLSNGKFILAGDMTLINGASTVNRFAVVNETNGSLVQSPNGSAIGSVYKIIESTGRLLVGFDNNSAPSSSGCCLGVYDIDNLTPISHSLGISPASGARVNDLYINGNDLYLMGSFNSVRSENKSNFVSLTLDTLQLTEFSPSFGAEVYAIRESLTDYFFIGRFLTVSGRKRAYLARVRKSDKSLID